MDRDKMQQRVLAVTQAVYHTLYSRPRKVLKILTHPSSVIGESYFPEKKGASKARVVLDQIRNVIFNGDTDEYYYMYGLDVKPRSEARKYVSYPEFMKRRDKLNLSSPHNSSCILRNKFYFGLFAKSLGIRTPENYAYIDNSEVTILGDSARQIGVRELAYSLPRGQWVYKPLDGECGRGVAMIDISDDGVSVDGIPSSTNALESVISNGKGIIQPRLTQHPEMSRIYPRSVNTIRMTTVRNPRTGEIEILPPTLRIGAHGNLVDNFSQGGVIIALDTETGRLSPTGYFKPEYGFKATRHPDTGVEFSSFVIPFYQEAKAMAVRFHSFLDLHSIGWDIAIDEDGPMFIEGNDNWEINLPQNADKPFRDEFNRLFY